MGYRHESLDNHDPAMHTVGLGGRNLMRKASIPIVIILALIGLVTACKTAGSNAEAALPEPAKDQCKLTLKVSGMM